MFWYLPALSFTAYFLAGIFPLIMNPRYLTDPNHWYLEDCLMNWNAAFVCLLLAAPLVGSIVMMSYLHHPARAMTIHAQPFSRSKIFWSHTLTGWLMCILPPGLMTVIYLLIAGQPGHSLLFGATSLSIITFFYGIFIFAGVLVGNSVMHVLLCGVFFGIIPLVLWLTWFYCENFLTGFYNAPDWMEDFLFDTNPMFYQFSNNGEWFGAGRILIYMAIGLLFTCLGCLLYRRAKLEHVGDSMLFRTAEEIITWLVVFVGMTVFGLFFSAVSDDKYMTLIGMVFGTLLSFIIVKIVLNRTIKIVTRQNLQSLGAFTIILAVFVGCTMYDLTGFTHRVPDPSRVTSIDRTDLHYEAVMEYRYDYIQEELMKDRDILTSPEAIEKVTALHQYIVDHELYHYDDVSEGADVYDSSGNEVYQGNFWITFRYTLDNGREMTRRFSFRLNQEVAELMNEVVTDKEYKDDSTLLDLFTAENISHIELHVYDYNFEAEEKFQTGQVSDVEMDTAYRNAQATLIITEPEEIREILVSLDKDHRNQTYTINHTSANSNAWNYMDVGGSIHLKPGTDDIQTDWTGTVAESGSKPVGAARFSLPRTYTNTLLFLEELLREEGYDQHADHISQK